MTTILKSMIIELDNPCRGRKRLNDYALTTLMPVSPYNENVELGEEEGDSNNKVFLSYHQPKENMKQAVFSI